MNYKKFLLLFASVFFLLFLIQACQTYYFRKVYSDHNQLLYESKALRVKPFLKAHLKNGNVCIFRDSWHVDSLQQSVTGEGSQFDINRAHVSSGHLSIPLDSIALFETNNKIEHPEKYRIAALSILVAIDVIVGIVCLTNPKACFGSCPTFYVNENHSFHYADAEGFSNAISPSLEYGDIDALNNPERTRGEFSITMKNEALETHCVNEVKLYAIPRSKGERVYQSKDDSFYLCGKSISFNTAHGPSGDLASLLMNDDRSEWFSLADSNHLNTKEEVLLEFNNTPHEDSLGLVLDFRQTLMSTYLFYSAMAYMGEYAGEVFALLETQSEWRMRFDAASRLLGGIEVYTWSKSKQSWIFQGDFNETGPIAINRQILPLKMGDEGHSLKVKLILNKGLWRIDRAILTQIIQKVNPYIIEPNCIYTDCAPDPEALDVLTEKKKYLISMPGNAYKISFLLPDAKRDYELFLFSKGYYLEWVRASWIHEKNFTKLRQMVYQPQDYLKNEAKAYKSYEKCMERDFWNSRICTKEFTYEEH